LPRTAALEVEPLRPRALLVVEGPAKAVRRVAMRRKVRAPHVHFARPESRFPLRRHPACRTGTPR
jgi:hypothetical protein